MNGQRCKIVAGRAIVLGEAGKHLPKGVKIPTRGTLDKAWP